MTLSATIVPSYIENTNSDTVYHTKYIPYFLLGDSTNRTESNKSATSLYENTQPSTTTNDNTYYEQVELRSTAAVQSEEMELSSNVAYGRVQR